MTLFHYTCDHGHAQLGPESALVPAIDIIGPGRDAPWTAQFVWLTDMDTPDRNALGLTSNILNCDRLSHRYRVVDEHSCVWWPEYAARLHASTRHEIEDADGARPRHWWVALQPVQVVYDPVRR